MKLKMKKAVLGSTGKSMNIMRGFSCRSDKSTAVLRRSTTTIGSRAAVHPPPTRRHHHHHRPALFVTSNENYMLIPAKGPLLHRDLSFYYSVQPKFESSTESQKISPFVGNEKYMRLVQKPRRTFRDYASSPPSPARRGSRVLLFSGGCSAASLALAPVRKGSGGGDDGRREKARKPPARRSSKTLLFSGGCSAASLAFAPVRNGSGDGARREKARKPPSTAVASSTLSSSNTQVFQVGGLRFSAVVVMRVSLHCQGCASKVKKHLSKMEGVTSFSIDLENKKVTVTGNVSPAGVLESVSKVKRAEFWPC